MIVDACKDERFARRELMAIDGRRANPFQTMEKHVTTEVNRGLAYPRQLHAKHLFVNFAPKNGWGMRACAPGWKAGNWLTTLDFNADSLRGH